MARGKKTAVVAAPAAVTEFAEYLAVQAVSIQAGNLVCMTHPEEAHRATGLVGQVVSVVEPEGALWPQATVRFVPLEGDAFEEVFNDVELTKLPPAGDCHGEQLLLDASVRVATAAVPRFKDYSSRYGTVVRFVRNGDLIPFVDVAFPETRRQRDAVHRFCGDELQVAPAEPQAEPVAAPVVHHALQYVPLTSIDIVRNTRSSYDEASLAELTESVRAKGVIQPVTLRPHPEQQGRYQLAAGHRRFLASQRAGLVDIPASIRPMSDHEFLETQVLENLQRENIHPADEAVAFAELLANRFSADEIGARVGKSAQFVAQRAKLATLHPFWLEKLREGCLPLVAAGYVARQSAQVQIKLSQAPQQFLGYQSYQRNPQYSAQEIQNYISREVMRELAGAPWAKDDATLLPKAGACTDCPARTSRHALLFPEYDKADACMNALCFAQKLERFIERRRTELQAETGSAPVLASRSYSPAKKDALSYSHWDVAKADTPGAVPVLVVEGNDAGHVVYAKLTGKALESTSPAAAAAEKKKRQEENRQQRIGSMEKILQAQAMYEHVSQHSLPTGQLLHWLNGQIFRYGGPHRDMRASMVNLFGFPEPKGGTAKMEDASIKGWVNRHIQTLSHAQQLALYFTLLTYNEYSFKLPEWTQVCGADLKKLRLRATKMVDKEPDPDALGDVITGVMQGKEVTT